MVEHCVCEISLDDIRHPKLSHSGLILVYAVSRHLDAVEFSVTAAWASVHVEALYAMAAIVTALLVKMHWGGMSCGI